MNRRFSLILISVVMLINLMSARPAFAHGEDAAHLLEEASVGPYALSVNAAPNPITAGRVVLVAEVSARQGQELPADSEILLIVTPLAGSGPGVRSAGELQIAGPNSRYEAELLLETPGAYRAVVQLQDGSGWVGETSFQFQVLPVSPWMHWIIIVLLSQAAVFGLWLAADFSKVWMSKRSEPRLIPLEFGRD